MNTKLSYALAATAAALVAAGCASIAPDRGVDDAAVAAMMKASFSDRGIASVDRLERDLAQRACSAEKAPADALARQIEQQSMATIKWPAGGNYLGDWREGEKLAQNGRGMTWTDATPNNNGANCYNCHQLSKSELSFGTIGPSLAQYGKLRGVSDPAAPAAQEIVKYTWGKLYNAKATSACSNMPRFGHKGILTEAQMRDVMALLLDPKSPVNQ